MVPRNTYASDIEFSDKIWGLLKVLVVRNSHVDSPECMATLFWLVSRVWGRMLQHIEIQSDQHFDYNPSIWTVKGAVLATGRRELVQLMAPDEEVNEHRDDRVVMWGSPNVYAALRTLRLTGLRFRLEEIEEAFEGPVRSGTLQSFDIFFPVEDRRLPAGQTCLDHLNGHNWLRGSPSIRSLGIFNVSFPSYPVPDGDNTLLGFLASFPNLETLEISDASQGTDQGFAAMLCAIIVAGTSIKTIFQHDVVGTAGDTLHGMAKERGVAFVLGPRPMPWPLSLHQEDMDEFT